MPNLLQKSLEILEAIPQKRTRDIIVRRFGLKKGQPETLEAIGQNYKITRERVRQIEESGLKILRQPQIISSLKPIFLSFQKHLKEHGNLRREVKLLEELSSPGEDFNRYQGAVALFLNLGQAFYRHGQTEKFYPLWTINKTSLKQAEKIIGFLINYFNSKNTVLSEEEVLAIIQKKNKNINKKILFSYIDASKAINQNLCSGKLGLAHWPEIKPRGVKDKAYIVLKKENQPLHFSRLTELINQESFDERKAHIQTVHNELIKDPRFVLIGRGTYALAEWGYEPGTVVELIIDILKKEGPLERDEILKRITQKRLVKENTILINLQNRKLFSRDQKGRYSLA